MKYYKPKSVTWWVSAAQIIIGILLAGLPETVWAFGFLSTLTGGIEPYALIMAGAGGIGLRGAMP